MNDDGKEKASGAQRHSVYGMEVGGEIDEDFNEIAEGAENVVEFDSEELGKPGRRR